MTGAERVFAVPRAEFFDGAWPEGFVRLEPAAAARLLERWARVGEFLPRARAERDPSWKQVIPYCSLTRGDHEIFVVERHATQGEARLHGLLSIGLGGHVEPRDAANGRHKSLFENALRRELDEELRLPDNAPPPCLLGLINDDETPVGSVHVGLVHRLDLSYRRRSTDRDHDVRIREIRKMSGGFRRLPGAWPTPGVAPAPVAEAPELWQDPQRFESWSRILLEAVYFRPKESGRASSLPPNDDASHRTPT